MSGPSLVELRSRIESVLGRGPAPVIVKTLDNHVSQTALAPLHIATTLICASTMTAQRLRVLGLFGAMGDPARQRHDELTIRIAFGTQRRRVMC